MSSTHSNNCGTVCLWTTSGVYWTRCQIVRVAVCISGAAFETLLKMSGRRTTDPCVMVLMIHLCDHTHVRNAGHSRSVRTVIRQHINDMPSTSACSIARQMGVSHSTVWAVLWANHHHPYRWQKGLEGSSAELRGLGKHVCLDSAEEIKTGWERETQVLAVLRVLRGLLQFPGCRYGHRAPDIGARVAHMLRVPASHQGESGSIHDGVTPGFSNVGIVPDEVTGRWVFSGISRFPGPCIPATLHAHLISPTSAPKTSRYNTNYGTSVRAVVRPRASNHGEQGSIPGGVTPGFAHMTGKICGFNDLDHVVSNSRLQTSRHRIQGLVWGIVSNEATKAKIDFTKRSILKPASFHHWLLHTCEVTPFLTGLHVIGARSSEVFGYWCGVTQGVSNKAWFNDEFIAKAHVFAVRAPSISRDIIVCLLVASVQAVYRRMRLLYRTVKHSLTLLLPAYHWLTVKRGVSKELSSNHNSRRKE
ncbi:hypothetical protein PR048_007651 [Dryococelus australis]|uniref:Transposase n=1 Tax=Dryococelus australis TaxID=614101 RepID=A0ABQ9HUU3_9NEOP|nr:hypothetical protein PR048_007651 [Dryococelus australis]